MSSRLMFGVLALHVVIFAINTIGTAVLGALAWSLYLKLPSATGRTARRHQELKKEVIHWKREMTATSAQDQFAKWAKLRRKHDKTLEEYEQCNKTLVSAKVQFDMIFSTTRWLVTSGLKLAILFWYSKTPAFVLPFRWIPWPIEWILAFPRAPTGTVSLSVWSGVCSTVVDQIGGAIFGPRVPVNVPVQAVSADEKEEKKSQ